MINSSNRLGDSIGNSGLGAQQNQPKSPEEIQKKIKELEGALKLEQSPEKKKTIEKQLENLHKMLKGGPSKGGSAAGGESAGGSSDAVGGGDSVDLRDSDRETAEAGQAGASNFASQVGQVGQAGQANGVPSAVGGVGEAQGIGGDPTRPSLQDLTSQMWSNHEAQAA